MYSVIVLLHILSATISVGGHLIMVTVFLPQALQKKDPKILVTFMRNFGKIGNPSLILLILTGLYLGYNMLENLSELFSFKNHMSILVSSKLILLFILTILITIIKLHAAPNVKPKTLPKLALYIVSLTIIAVLLVIAGLSFRLPFF